VEIIKLYAMQQLSEIPEQRMRSSSSGRTNGICAATQVGHTSRRNNRFSIVSFTVLIWILLHLASHTHTHTHTHSIKFLGTANHAIM